MSVQRIASEYEDGLVSWCSRSLSVSGPNRHWTQLDSAWAFIPHRVTDFTGNHYFPEIARFVNMSEEIVLLFTGAGLSEQKAKETIKNDAVTTSFKQAIDQVKMKLIDYRITTICPNDAMTVTPNLSPNDT